MKRKVIETVESTYSDYSIMTDKERGLSCNTEILREIERQFEYAEENNADMVKNNTYTYFSTSFLNLIYNINMDNYTVKQVLKQYYTNNVFKVSVE